ncbi:MAG: response regulator transcription factor [Rickettsia endosymbiont of Oxypoda opaca]|nr:response regulator transcription factor [Rickettsia endosymbiont of Oxypoda opaca]
MRVLLIEDEPQMANLIELTLASEGIVCDIVSVGTDGLKVGKIYKYDLIILDIMLPDISGFEVLLRLRAVKVKTPILILSGLTSMDQKITGFSSGADNYLTKPFVREELIARIKAIVRRSKGHSESVFRFDKVSVNLDTRSVEVDERKVHLTNKEYAILELLILRRGTILTKEMFLNHLYNNVGGPEMKIIDVFICKLRKKLSDAAGGKDYIDTVWGRGYMLKEHDETSGEPLAE